MESPAQEIRDAAVVEGMKDIAFGSVAGMVSKVFEHPFDLCKVRLQAQVLDTTARFNGPVDCLVTTWKKEGLRGLYRGLPAPVVGAMAENASLFLAYGQLQHLCRWWSASSSQPLSTPQLLLSAAGAGAVTSFILTPIELIKCKMQVQLLTLETSGSTLAVEYVRGSNANAVVLGAAGKPNFSALPGPLSVLKTVVQTNGIRGLWLGQTGTLIRETGGAAAWFGTKEGVCKLLLRRHRRTKDSDEPLTKKDLKAWESALAGACAGIAYNGILFPADSVKSALQTAEELRPQDHKNGQGPSFWRTARDMFRRQGIRGLYAGMGVTVARAIPSNAIIFLVYDELSKRFG